MVEPSVTEAELHAYVDGQLDVQRREMVAAYLRENEYARQIVRQYQQQNAQLQAMYDPVLDETVPQHLLNIGRRRTWLRVAAVAAWLSVGAAIGWQMHPDPLPMPAYEQVYSFEQHLVHPAAFAHRIYSAEVKHPVEVTAAHEKHLVKWLSKRLDTPMKVPDLHAKGYALVGGRLLPSTDNIAAQFMYDRSDGKRITLYTRRGKWQEGAAAFQYASDNGMSVFYWADENMAYALVGEINRSELLMLSMEVYKQLQ